MTHTLTFSQGLPMPAAVGNLDAYIQAAKRLPLLSAEEETALARRLRDNNDLDAARQLVLSHLRLVISVARGYMGYGLPHADLIQEGNIGLMKAVKRFDPDRGVRLVSFAMHWVKAEIHEYIVRNWRMVKIATTKAQRKLFFNLRSMKPGLDTLTPGEVADVAQRLDVKPEEVVEMEARLAGHEIAIDSGSDDDEERSAPITWLGNADLEPSRVLEARAQDYQQGEGLQLALAGLDPRSRHVLEARWLADEPATLHELAAEYGVSAERIRQIEVKAMKTMRGLLQAA